MTAICPSCGKNLYSYNSGLKMDQPKPKGKGREIAPLVVKDVLERVEHGAKTYGEPLKANNGRSALQDAYEEALDLCLYLRQRIEEEKTNGSNK